MIYQEDIARIRGEELDDSVSGYISILERRIRELKGQNKQLVEGIKEIIEKCQIMKVGNGG